MRDVELHTRLTSHSGALVVTSVVCAAAVYGRVAPSNDAYTLAVLYTWLGVLVGVVFRLWRAGGCSFGSYLRHVVVSSVLMSLCAGLVWHTGWRTVESNVVEVVEKTLMGFVTAVPVSIGAIGLFVALRAALRVWTTEK